MHAGMKAAVLAFAETAGAKIGAAARRTTVAVLCAVAAAAFAVASLGCAVAALWIFVLPTLGPVGAALVAAAALLLLCLSLLAVVAIILRRPPAPAPTAARSGVLFPSLITELTRLFDETKGAALLGAFLAGVNAAKSQTREEAGRRTTR
jgi:hypothetical protein